MLYLLDKDVKTVKWNGIPLHEASSAIVKEETNGDFYLNVHYPITDSGVYQLIKEDMLIKAPVPVLGAQLFRIKKPVENDDSLDITAYHVSDDIMKRSIRPVSVVGQGCAMALSQMVQNAKTGLGDFSFTSDIMDSRTFNTTETETLYSVLLDGKHSIVGTWEGELVRDNFALTIKRNRGADRGVVITTHKNLKSYQRTKNSQGVVTRIHAKSTFKPDGAEDEVTLRVTVDSPLIGNFPYINEKEYENNDVKTIDELKKWAEAKFKNEGIDKVSDAIEIEAYELDGQVVHLGDTVNIKSSKHSVDIYKKAIAYEYNALTEEYISITFDDKPGVGGSGVSSGVSNAADVILGVNKTAQEVAIERAVRNANQAFDAEFEKQKIAIEDGIEQAKAEAELYADNIKQSIDADVNAINQSMQEQSEEHDRQVVEILSKTQSVESLANQAKSDAASAITQALQLKDEAIADAANAKESALAAVTNAQQAVTDAGQANDLAQQAITDAGQAIADAANAKESALAAVTDAQQAVTDADNAKADALSAITKADNTRTELLGRVDTLDSKAADLTTKTTNLQTLGNQLNTKTTDLKTQADNISSQLNTFTTETGTKFQNQSKTITDLQGTLSQYESTIQTLDGTVTNHTSQLTQQATQIASKVAQTEFNTEKTKISNLQTSVSQQAGQIALKAEKTELNNLTGRVTNAESSITQQATQIASKVSQTEFNTEKTKISNLQTSVTQQAGQIALKANTTSVDTLAGRVATAEGKITTQAGLIELKANKTTVDTLTGRVSSTESKITATDGKVTTLTTKTDGHTTSIGQLQTSYSGLSSTVTNVDWMARTNGALQLTPDPTFLNSNNLLLTYNNSGNSNVTLTRDQLEEGQPTGSPYIIKISTTGSPTFPGLGGFVRSTVSRANAIFMVKFTAKLPTGYTLWHANNSIGIGGKTTWVTSREGTGTWVEYAYVVECGSSGEFRDFGYVYIYAGVAPVTWYISKYETFDISKSQQQAFSTLEQNLSGFKTTVQNTYADKTTVSQLASKVELKANTTSVDTLTGRVSTAEGKITTQAGLIELKANKTELDNLTGRVSTAESSITQQAGQIALKATTTEVNNLTGRVSTAEGKITTQAGQIALKAEKTYVDTVKQTVDSHTTSITQQASQIALKANQTDYNNLTGRMSTAESSITQNATEISKRLTSTQVNQVILDNKQIKDTRSDNQSPQWYWTNYPKQTVEEFKGSAVIGLTSESTYAILTTNVQWIDSSGGKVKQTAKTDRATFERYGTGTTWEAWTKIANVGDLANYTTKTEFQSVKETTSLYERVIGSTEVNVKDKIARIVMSDSLFMTDVKNKVDGTSTQVTQLADSYAIKNLSNSGTVLNQLNLNKDGSIKIDGSLVQITGKTYIQDGVISAAKIGDLDAGKIKTGTLNAARIATNSITGSHIAFDQAFVNKMTANEALFKQLFAQSAFITSVQAVTLSASNVTTGILRATNGAMDINLDNANITFNQNATINFNSDSNALVRKKGDVTAFVNFADDLVSGGVYAGFGVTSHAVGVTTADNNDRGKFAGMRVYRPNDSVDLVRLIGDTVELRHGTEGNQFRFNSTQLRNNVDMLNLAGAVYTLSRIFIHLRINGWSFNHPSFIEGVKYEMARNWLDDFAIGGLPR